MEVTRKDYKEWLKLRDASKDEFGDKLCYCGHTNLCSCGDPSFGLFKESVENGTIKLGDPKNGWRPCNCDIEEINNDTLTKITNDEDFK